MSREFSTSKLGTKYDKKFILNHDKLYSNTPTMEKTS